MLLIMVGGQTQNAKLATKEIIKIMQDKSWISGE